MQMQMKMISANQHVFVMPPHALTHKFEGASGFPQAEWAHWKTTWKRGTQMGGEMGKTEEKWEVVHVASLTLKIS